MDNRILANELRKLADIGIVNAHHDTRLLLDAANALEKLPTVGNLELLASLHEFLDRELSRVCPGDVERGMLIEQLLDRVEKAMEAEK